MTDLAFVRRDDGLVFKRNKNGTFSMEKPMMDRPYQYKSDIFLNQPEFFEVKLIDSETGKFWDFISKSWG